MPLLPMWYPLGFLWYCSRRSGRVDRAMRNVLMIYDKFPPVGVSGSQRPFQFAKHLPTFGYLPYIISAEPEPGEPCDPAPLAELDPRCTRVQLRRLAMDYGPQVAALRHGVARALGAATRTASPNGPPRAATGSQRAAAPRRVGPPEIHSAKDYAYYASNWLVWFHADWALPVLRQALRAARREPIDLVWSSGPASRNLFAAYLVSLVLRKPMVADIRDPWTYGSIWQPIVAGAGPVEAFWAHRILAHVERSIFTSPMTEAQMRARFPGRAADRMCTITNGFADTEPPGPPLRGAGEDKLLLSYVGSLNARRKPDVLLEALSRLSRDPAILRDLRLQFVGGMAGHECKIVEHGLREQVIDVGRVDYAQSVRYMWGADVNVLLQTITEGQDVIAGKTFEYLAARKPILGVVSPDGGDAWLLRDTGAGEVVAFDDAGAVANAIASLHMRWSSGELPRGMSEQALERFDRRTLTKQLAAVFDEVVQPHGSHR